MENEPDLIRDQMQETRTALTEKLDTLQQKVAETVEGITTPVTETVQTVKEAVSETVDSVKDTVSGTVDTVKETFNLPLQVERHPWPMMFGAFATGFALGKLLPPAAMARSVGLGEDAVAAGMTEAARGDKATYSAAELPQTPRPQQRRGLFDNLTDLFRGELDKLVGLGVSAGLGLVRDFTSQSVQGELGDRIREWMDGLTEKLGGKPFSEPLLTPQGNGGVVREDARRGPPAAESERSAAAGSARPYESKPRW